MEVYKTDFTAIKKKDGSPLTKADMDSSEIITQYLQPTNIPIVGEESEIAPFKERKSWNENWCIDQLDGTRMFLKKNGEFSVNIAHIQKGKSVFGIIASPTHQRILFGGSKFGVYKCAFDTIDDISTWEKQKPRKKSNNPLTITCSRSYVHGSGYKYIQLLERKYGELVYLRKGSAMKFFALADGRADIYARFAPTMEWDIAAGQAILEALGGSIVNVNDNKPLRYNKESLYNPTFIAKTKAIIKV